MKIERDLGDGYAVVRIGDKYSVMGAPRKREWFDSLAACLLAWEINKPTNMKDYLGEKSLEAAVVGMSGFANKQDWMLAMKPTKILIHPSTTEKAKQILRSMP